MVKNIYPQPLWFNYWYILLNNLYILLLVCLGYFNPYNNFGSNPMLTKINGLYFLCGWGNIWILMCIDICQIHITNFKLKFII
jgi:hypothetical protein